MAKKSKKQARKRTPIRDLRAKNAKAGKGQQEFLIVKMSDVIIT
jgi:hypothetical protein